MAYSLSTGILILLPGDAGVGETRGHLWMGILRRIEKDKNKIVRFF
jgi:hypothetical protein